MDDDTWHRIPGHPKYEITRLGQVRRVGSSRVLKTGITHGYLRLSLGSKSKNNRVHVLVAATFIGPRPEGYHINHKDGDRANPHVENLEYVTPGQNVKHAVDRIGEWGSVLMIAGAHRAKTHCPKGHPYDDKNTFHYPRGARGCRRCMYDASYARQKANPEQSRRCQKRYRDKKRAERVALDKQSSNV